MPLIDLNTFHSAIQDLRGNDTVVVLEHDKKTGSPVLSGLKPSKSAKVDGFEMRQAFFAALVQGGGDENGLKTSLGLDDQAKAHAPLTIKDIKIHLDERSAQGLARFAVSNVSGDKAIDDFVIIGEAPLASQSLFKTEDKTGMDATAAAIRQAGEQAISTNHLMLPNEKQFLADLKAAGDLSKDVIDAFKNHLSATRSLLKTAYALKGEVAATPKGQAVIKSAMDALAGLEHLTRQIHNRIVRHNGEPPAELEEMIDFAASRHAELQVVGGSLEGLLAFEATVGMPRNVGRMVAMLAGKMHTSADVVEQLQVKMSALDERMTQLEADGGKRTNMTEIAEIEGELAAVSAFAQGLRESGMLKLSNSVQLHLENSFTDGLDRHLRQIASSLQKAKQTTIRKGLDKFLDEMFPPSAQDHQKMGPTVKQIRNLIKARVDSGHLPDKEFISSLVKLEMTARRSAYKTQAELNADEDFPSVLAKNAIRMGCQKIAAMMHAMQALPQDAVMTTNGDLKKMLAGQVGLETVLGARTYGFDDTMIDDRFDDAWLTFEKKLGEGAANEVTLVKYLVQNEQGGMEEMTRVFKPEVPAFMGLGRLLGGRTGFDGSSNTVAQINRASYQAAKMLGAEHIMPKITVGMHNEQFGFFMEKADGETAGDYRLGKHTDGTSLAEPFPRNLDKTETTHLKGSLMKGTNELMWTDWLTGQSDRHQGNYLVSIDENYTAYVKGVDNDLSFSAERVGLRKFHLNRERLIEFLNKAGCQSVEEYNRKHPNHPLTPVDGNPKLMLIDAGDDRDVMCWVGAVFGVNSCPKPMTIGRGMYEKLIALGRLSPDELRNEMARMLRTGFTELQLAATVSRLTEMIAHVRTFDETQILSDKDWESPDVQRGVLTRAEANQFSPNMHDGPNRKFVTASKDYFLRDFAALF